MECLYGKGQSKYGQLSLLALILDVLLFISFCSLQKGWRVDNNFRLSGTISYTNVAFHHWNVYHIEVVPLRLGAKGTWKILFRLAKRTIIRILRLLHTLWTDLDYIFLSHWPDSVFHQKEIILEGFSSWLDETHCYNVILNESIDLNIIRFW